MFLVWKPHGQRSLAGYSPWGHRVGHDWATEQLSTKKNPPCISYPQKGQGSSSYMKSLIFLVVCIHSKGDDDAIIDSHHIHSDFIATWVQIRLTLVTKDKWLNNHTIPSSQNTLGFWSFFRCWNCASVLPNRSVNWLPPTLDLSLVLSQHSGNCYHNSGPWFRLRQSPMTFLPSKTQAERLTLSIK